MRRTISKKPRFQYLQNKKDFSQDNKNQRQNHGITPSLLVNSGYYPEIDDTLSIEEAEKEDKARQEPFEVVFVSNLPQQAPGSMDCGVFVAAYAEYLSGGFNIPILEFDANYHRIRYASLLWEYGSKKHDAGAISDNEAPPRPVRPRINYDSVSSLVIE